MGERHVLEPHPEIPAGADCDALLARVIPARNDLEAPARSVAPIIDAALSTLRAEGSCRLARMSGSGATVFGLFTHRSQAALAAHRIRARHPGWWVKPVLLR